MFLASVDLELDRVLLQAISHHVYFHPNGTFWTLLKVYQSFLNLKCVSCKNIPVLCTGSWASVLLQQYLSRSFSFYIEIPWAQSAQLLHRQGEDRESSEFTSPTSLLALSFSSLKNSRQIAVVFDKRSGYSFMAKLALAPTYSQWISALFQGHFP
ncbi:hypothetical protein U0070_001379 [Myodes glareolus]|uniref:Uncharacterized protein n=1 Tax=Myodes glareolus TaxID=447135 RepID=A0AAW0HF94_MYOGA